MLSLLGVPSHLKGYQYLKTGIDLCIQSLEELDGITKRLYPDIAGVYHTSAETVEHAIRHAIEAAWQRGDETTQRRLFGYSHLESRRPTNLEFISRLADHFINDNGKYLS
ncbi:MAG TPA: sporulation initiation factor Spo0A C-terminal domain-containing protein [Candidatus Eisenbergiella merdipullorum]|uniref:Sporulation initiation factor Spo0A C-terminal domain-containing protein n=1 Tax=Candidatus Eisenbergiella merdipullorum TaxID=2838553 RepID=A0A9D2I7Q6_9FIRM|nr:sporulation initiation factor Spo0A C-terminal domain-containing protein [Candidatus Eisenbergiella merdipullorum]